MAPQQQEKPAGKPAPTVRPKPGKGEVKVSVLNIRSPFSAETIRPVKKDVKRSVAVLTPQPSLSSVKSQTVGEPVSSKTPQIVKVVEESI